MKLTFRKHEVKDLCQLQALVAEHPETVEPGFRILATSANFGRSAVELVGLDRHKTPALIALGFTGDDAMIFRMVEAYAWSVEYPESVRRHVSDGDTAGGWPPRVVFIAERLPESFLRKIRLLAFPAVNCFEYRCVEVNDTTGFYLDPVDWAASEPAHAAPPATPAAPPPHPDTFRLQGPPAATRPDAERTQPSRWFGLLATPESQAPDRSAGRAEFPAWAAASSGPVVETPAVAKPPREPASEPAQPADDARLDDHHELTPAWRKFLEKLAGTFDPRPAENVAVTPTETTAGPAPEPAKAHTGPSRNGDVGRHEDADQRALLDVVKLPPNGELVSQWRKFLEKAPLDDAKIGKFVKKPTLDDMRIEKFPERASLDDAKIGKFSEKPLLNDNDANIAAVREYLHHEFPMCTIYDFFDYHHNAQVLQVQDAQGKVCHLVTIALEFFEAHRDSELRVVLDRLRLPSAMRQAGQAGVVVTADGLEAPKR